MSLLRQLGRAGLGRLAPSSTLPAAWGLAAQRQQGLSSAAAEPAQAAAAEASPHYDVPAGHQDSDLSSLACNISLTRRKDLTLREDIHLTVDGQPRTLKELLKGQRVALFGVPDCGKVCSEQHAPGYAAAAPALRKLGIGSIVCVAVGDADAAQQWAGRIGLDPAAVSVAADTRGALTRFLGLELGPLDAPGPRSQRYSALVDDGILLKICIEKSPAEVQASSAEAMLKLAQAMGPQQMKEAAPI